MKNITVDALETLNQEEIDQLPVSVLFDMTNELDNREGKIKVLKQKIVHILDRRYSKTASETRARLHQDTGIVNIIVDDFIIKSDVTKKVRWDQAQLLKVLSEMTEDEARHYAKAKYEIDERKYQAATPDIQAKLRTARTVEPGKPTYKIAPLKKEAA